MRPLSLLPLLLLALAACCPAPQFTTAESDPTAFVAEVIGLAANPQGLRLKVEGQPEFTVAVTETTVITDAQGERLELAELMDGGRQVYLIGRFRSGGILADEIHVLAG